MQITPNEISSIDDSGMLDGSPVKMIRTKGGFFIAVGKLKGKLREEALAAGSHPAIVKFNLEKQYPTFQPSMMKSEGLSEVTIVDKHSHFLSDVLRKSGHDIYSVQDGNLVNFHITKHNMHVASVSSHLENQNLVFKEIKMGKEFSRALAGATVEKAAACGALKVKIEGK